MENESTKTGLVGLFDILGYQNLLERNEPEEIAEKVLPTLTNIGGTVMERLETLHDLAISAVKPENEILAALEKDRKKIIENMTWLVFSDTVLLTLQIDEEDPFFVFLSWLLFINASILLQTDLFLAGLPIRGAIDYGKFLIRNTCFAGRTIVNSYKLCSQIELSACVLTKDATNKFYEIRLDNYWIDQYVVEYLVPVKSGETYLLTVMAPINIAAPDIHNEVMRAFWGNKKDIPLSVRQKAQNTEQWLEFIEYRRKMNEQKKS